MSFSLGAEWLKTKNTFIRMILYSSPILFNLVIFGYIKLANQRISDSGFYFNYFSILNFLIPFIICFILGLIMNCEREAGNFKNIFGLNRHYYSLLSSKFIFTYLLLSLIFFINSLLTFILLKLTFNVSFTAFYIHFLYGFTLTWFSFLTSFVLYFFLSIIFSFITILFVGLTCSLLTAIIGLTALGNGIWIFFPFTWGSRLLMLDIKTSSFMTLFHHLSNNLVYILFLSPIVLFILLIFACVTLYRK